MKGKVLFVAGLAVGYVLGTRDGRRRYEQIKSAAQNIWESEPVQWGATQAREAIGDVADIAIAGAKKVINQATATNNIDKPAAKRPAAKRPAAPAAAKASTTAAPVTKPIPTVEPSARSRAAAPKNPSSTAK
ncbi:MAG: hypothetical protein RLZZ600_193 [Actinomycetota bacterium]|jgi:hypothetical protein